MQRFLAEGEALQQVAVMGLRAPDGSVSYHTSKRN